MQNLTVSLPSASAERPLLADVSLTVKHGQVVGLVGESGSGKSTTARAALGAFPDRSSVSGHVEVAGVSVTDAPAERLREIRRRKVAMIFQDPRSAVNPVRRVGDFITENLVFNLGVDKRSAHKSAIELLGSVGLSDPERIMRQYPGELSGGMLQRAVIAACLTGDPGLILADEATSALDVSTQAEVLAILHRLRDERDVGVLLITHDLHLAASFCDVVYVMYAGRIVERCSGPSLFDACKHPYTQALLACTPSIDGTELAKPLPGRPLSLAENPPGCPFADRCDIVEEACRATLPQQVQTRHGFALCRRVEQENGRPEEASA